MRGTDASTAAVHNFDNRSDRYVIPHDELFLGHFEFTPRNQRHIITLGQANCLGNFEERLHALTEKEAVAEGSVV